MKRLVPFNVWFSDVEELLESINKTNFEVLDNIENYKFGFINHQKVKSGLYSFTSKKDGSRFNTPQNIPAPPQPQQIAAGQSIVTLPAVASYVINSSLETYSVQIVCSPHKILKIEVVENYNGTFRESVTTHNIVFHDNDIMVNGEWYKIDSPDAFINDASSDDISILAILELIERFRK